MSDAPLRIAIIGSGPSGFYAADALIKQAGRPIAIDMFDRLPTPYGLVRGGVAPDHQSIKAVIKIYDKVAANPVFRFFGNVTLGNDLFVSDLESIYDAWVYAFGNERDKRLGIPGEDLSGSHSATAFVGWYNAHPDHCDSRFDLTAERAAVIGVGNVAMDVTRLLVQDPAGLEKTDIADYALDALKQSRVREVYVLGRRGVAQAAFSPAEIQEIGELPGVDVVVRPDEVVVDELSTEDMTDPNTKKNVDFCTLASTRGEGPAPKKVRLRFLASPVEVIGENGKVTGLRIEKNRLIRTEKGVAASGTGEFEVLPVGLVFRSVGYRGIPIAGVPFDDKAGTVPNVGGRVVDPVTRQPLPHQYVVGWAKRGPSGLIGTNRGDSVATVQHLLADVKEAPLRGTSGDTVVELLASRGVHPTNYADWKRLDAHEVGRGTERGKLREKVVRVAEMLEAITKLRG